MKKFTNIFVALGVTLFLLTVGIKSEAVAKEPCPTGWTSVTDTVTVDGCEFEVGLCVLCSFSYPGQVKFNYFKQLDDCASILLPGQIKSQIMSQVQTYAYKYFDYCQFTLLPCDQKERKKIKFNSPVCWFARLYYKTQNDLRYYYLPCDDDAYCEVTYSYCVDKNGVVQSSPDPGFTPYNFPYDCFLEGHQVPLPTGEIGDESDCYILHTPCNL